MAILSDLINKSPGEIITADEIRLIGRLLNQRTTGPGVYQDDTGDHTHRAGGKGTKLQLVLLRSVEIKDDGAERDKILAQRLRYRDSPPKAGKVVAYGNEFEVYPMLGHSYGSYDFLRSVLPLIGELKDEDIHPNAFFAYEVVMQQGYWILKHLLRMPANVQTVDVDNIDYSGGGGT